LKAVFKPLCPLKISTSVSSNFSLYDSSKDGIISFILFTPQYHQFCEETLGSYLHHVPTTSNSTLGENSRELFADSYEATFGDIPNMWNTDLGTCLSGGCTPILCGPYRDEE
jgi:hypothetical protein